MPRRLPAAWIAPPVLAVLALPAIVALVAGAPALTSTATVRPSWSDPVAITACAGGATPGAGPAREPVADAAWRLGPALDADGTLQGWDLTMTAHGAATTGLRLPPEAAVRGPVDGWVVVAADDGQESTIALISPRAGCAATVHRDRQVVRQAILQPGTGKILFHSVGRSDRADLGVHITHPGSGRAPAQILPPLAATDPALAGVGRIWSTRLQLAHGAAQLAVQHCGEQACRTRLLDLGSGRSGWLPGNAHGLIAGLDSQTVVMFDACPGLPCPLVATALDGGGDRLLSAAAHSAQTVVVGERLVVVVVEEEHGGRKLMAIDAADGRRHRLAVDPSAMAVLPSLASTAGLEPRPGWIAALDERDGRPLGLDLTSLLATATEVSR